MAKKWCIKQGRYFYLFRYLFVFLFFFLEKTLITVKYNFFPDNFKFV